MVCVNHQFGIIANRFTHGSNQSNIFGRGFANLHLNRFEAHVFDAGGFLGKGKVSEVGERRPPPLSERMPKALCGSEGMAQGDELMAAGGRYHTMFELQASRFGSADDEPEAELDVLD